MKVAERGLLVRFLAIILALVGGAHAQVLDTVKLTILHLNDTYQFTPVDGGTRGGLARVLTIRKEALKKNPNTIMTLGGDTLSPSVETRTYRGKQMIDAPLFECEPAHHCRPGKEKQQGKYAVFTEAEHSFQSTVPHQAGCRCTFPAVRV